MKASDFILQAQSELNEKREGWSDEELLVKLQRSYVSLQVDLPFFIVKETLAIQKDKSDYTLLHRPIKNVSCLVGDDTFEFVDIENFYRHDSTGKYTFDNTTTMMLGGDAPIKDMAGEVVYRYLKTLVDANSEVEVPHSYYKALRLLFLSDIHEKPIASVDYRDMSVHYLKLYQAELQRLKHDVSIRPRNIKSNYQRV
jgi:hypothetical protein